MRPRRTLALPGCAALAILALILPGCGGGASAASEKATAQGGGKSGAVGEAAKTASPATAPRSTPQPPNRCRDQLGSFIDSLDALRRRLVGGLTYAQYSGRVRDLRAAYAAIPVGRLAPPCLVAVGTPGERAFDVYLEAANTWGECLSEPGCTAADVETTLQAEWHRAVRPLTEARAGLGRS